MKIPAFQRRNRERSRLGGRIAGCHGRLSSGWATRSPHKSANEGLTWDGPMHPFYFLAWKKPSICSCLWGWDGETIKSLDGEHGRKERARGLPSGKVIAHLEIWASRSHQSFRNYFQYFRKALENCTDNNVSDNKNVKFLCLWLELYY